MHAIGLVLALVGSAAVQEPEARLQKKIEECSRRISERFVFFLGGSGVFITEDGYCLTNHHVAGTQNQTKVTLFSGKQLPAKLVCTDSVGDLSLFKVQGAEGEKFPFVELGDSDRLEVGQYVLACGNPFGITLPAEDNRMYPTLTLGIVSALHRYQGEYFDCIQTDAAVNPGNSGGPLITLDGKLVGINGRIATRYMNRVNSGVGYAIPSVQIRAFLPEMMKGGDGGKAFHGMLTGLSLEMGPPGAGARVLAVRPDSAADRTGLRKGDLVTEVNGYRIFNRERFLGVTGMYPVGTEISLKIQRADEKLEVKGRLDKYNRMELAGLSLPQRPERSRPKGAGFLGIMIEEAKEGVKVAYVTSGSPADDADLREGDLLVKLGNRKISDRDDFNARIWQRKPGDRVKLTVLRAGKEMEVEVVLGKHPDD
ncbi:MAG TPA: PDZ domain-containing protein [Planctomycetota bacterium]|nr:PDZ domain-containing protein [Planctomycetota bacterium]